MIDAVPPCAQSFRDPDLWFSDSKDEIAEAKALCSTCPIKRACLAQGMTEPWGVWGGLSASERGLAPEPRQLKRDTHGTNVSYIKTGCRCASCKEARSVYAKAFYAKKKAGA